MPQLNAKCDATHKTIIQWNCRGIRGNFNQLELLIAQHQPVAICLQETKLPVDKKLDITNFNPYHHPSTDELSGGVSIYISSKTPHRQIKIKTKVQAVAVRVNLHRPITLCSIYLPPNLSISFRELSNLVQQLPAPYLLLGDFNAHNPLWGSDSLNTCGNHIENLMTYYNLTILNKKTPTYIHPANGTKSFIDLTLADPFLNFDLKWEISDSLHGSDHFPITISTKLPIPQQLPEHWNFSRADWCAFEHLCKENLTTDKITNIEQFESNLVEIAEACIPKTSSHLRKDKPWFNNQCKRAIDARKAALKALLKNPTQENLTNFRRQRALTRQIIRENKRTSWKNYVSKINSNTPIKKIFQMIKKIKGKNTQNRIQHLDRGNGEYAEEEKEIANLLGKTISNNSSGKHYCNTFQQTKTNAEKIALNFHTNEHLHYNELFTANELSSNINDTKNTAPGPDNIHNTIIKNLPEISKLCLLKIMNNIWTTGIFPDSWKKACIVPIPKPNKDHTNPSNYRPIALTSCLCKIMEKMINKRLNWYLETNNLLNNYQCGFRAGRSTTDHLIRLETLIRDAFINKQHMVAIFFDLEKAFDTTWKYGILSDMHKMGLRGNLPIFIGNFLSNRTFQVKLNSTLSDPFEQEQGVPQGSILSPTLFNIKINSITSTLRQNTDCSLYVDDFLICYKASSMSTIERQLQLQLNKIQTWANKNGFTFSTSKTFAVHFCRKRKTHADPTLFLNGNQHIPIKDEARFLGLTFDKKLNFLSHIKKLKNNCHKAMAILKTVSNQEWGGDRKSLLHLYRTIIRSRLDYGSIIYGSARKSYLKLLDPIHHQGVRLSIGAFKTTPAESLYVEANEPSLTDRRKKLALQYTLRLASQPGNPAYKTIFHPEHIEKYKTSENTIPPFGIRLMNATEIDIMVDQIEMHSPLTSPPWKLVEPTIIFDLVNYKKSSTSEDTYKTELQKIEQNFINHTHIYTDGSKDNEAVGSASHSILGDKVCGLNPHASVFTAECVALEMALATVTNSQHNKFIIFSDSLSALQAISMKKLTSPKIKNILCLLSDLSNSQKEIVLCWIPSHIGIDGNEKVDSLAKIGLELNPTDTKIPYTDLKPTINEMIHAEWQTRWNTLKENKLFSIQKEIIPRSQTLQKRRRDETVLTRLKLGHSHLTHSFLLKGEDRPKCIQCDQSLTISHILLDCIDFEDDRKRFYNCRTLKEIFNHVEPKYIISFIKQVGIYDKI